MKRISNHLRDPLSLVLTVLVVLSLLGAWMYGKETPGIDYYVAWAASDAVKNDTPHNIYKPISEFKLAVIYRNKADEMKHAPRQKRVAQHRHTLPMTATPLLYWVTGLIATGDYEKDLDNWHALSLFLLTVSILILCRILGYPIATSLAILLPVLVWFAPLHSDLRVANVNSFQLGVIGLIMWLQTRGTDKRYLFITGLAVGFLVMFKPNLAPVAVLLSGGWAIRGQFSKLLLGLSGMFTAAFSAVLLTSWWMGSATAWIDWINVIRKLAESPAGVEAGNHAVVSEITGGINSISWFGSIGQIDSVGQAILAIFLCLLCLVFLWWGRREKLDSNSGSHDDGREMIENVFLISMGCIVMLLASGIVWVHYYLLTIPMLIFVFRPLQLPGRMKKLPILMLRMFPVVALVALLDTVVANFIGVDSSTYWVAATSTSAIVLFIIGLWQAFYGVTDQELLKMPGEPVAH